MDFRSFLVYKHNEQISSSKLFRCRRKLPTNELSLVRTFLFVHVGFLVISKYVSRYYLSTQKTMLIWRFDVQPKSLMLTI